MDEEAPTPGTEDSPGFLRTAEGGYITHEDFVTFIAGASSAKGNAKERALAWLRRQGVTGPIASLSPAEVSRLTESARKVIVARKDRERRMIPRFEQPSPANDDDPPEEVEG